MASSLNVLRRHCAAYAFSRRIAVRPCAARKSLPSRVRIWPSTSRAQQRYISTDLGRDEDHASKDKDRASQIYEFKSLQAHLSTPEAEGIVKKRLLIDVREPNEFAGGHIPGAINIPIKSAPDAFYLPREDFEDRFGTLKPAFDQELIFYCKAGVRSRAAAQLAKLVGYKSVGEYPGSWLDWVNNGGAEEKP